MNIHGHMRLLQGPAEKFFYTWCCIHKYSFSFLLSFSLPPGDSWGLETQQPSISACPPCLSLNGSKPELCGSETQPGLFSPSNTPKGVCQTVCQDRKSCTVVHKMVLLLLCPNLGVTSASLLSLDGSSSAGWDPQQISLGASMWSCPRLELAEVWQDS